MSPAALPTGQWVHVAGTYDPVAGQERLYVDGDLVASQALTSALVYDRTDSGDLYLGKDPGVGEAFKGMIDTVGLWGSALTADEIRALATPVRAAAVMGRYVFYNGSVFDGSDPAADARDDGAIATDKVALLPGNSLSFANVTSYSRGINGVMIDIARLPQDIVLSPDDFVLRSGTGTNPSTWAPGPVPGALNVRRGAGTGGSDRVTLTWPDYDPVSDAITLAAGNAWLEVTVQANARTGLAAPDVFSFGNLIGEAGDSAASLRVSALDLSAVRRMINAEVPITATADFDRSGRVNALDMAVVKRNLNRPLPMPVANAALTMQRTTSGFVAWLGITASVTVREDVLAAAV
jgi:hypothetical protein